MKKYFWIMALIVALTLVFAGCGSASNEDEEEEEDLRGEPIEGNEAFWICPNQKGERKWPGDSVPLIGEDDGATYVHIFFQPFRTPTNIPNWDSFEVYITLEYVSDFNTPLSFMWQCAIDPYGTWARSGGDLDYIDLIYPNDPQTIKCQPNRVFTGSNWDETKQDSGKTKLTLPEMEGIVIQIPLDEGFEAGSVKVYDVKFENVGAGAKITGPHAPASAD